MKIRLFAGLLISSAVLLSGCAADISDGDRAAAETSGTSLQTTAQSQIQSSLWSPSPLVTAEPQTQSSVTASQKETATTRKSSTAGSTTAEKPAATTVTTVTKDKTAPVIFFSGTSSYHKRGTDFDLNNYVGYGDDTDRHPKLTYTGKVDKDKLGDYPLKATVTDASGNSVSWELTVHVVDKIPSSSGYSIPSMDFTSFKNKYKGDSTRFGIDVSQWQGKIDFAAVKNAGCSFVFIRIGTKFNSYTLDPYFKANLEGALAAGLDVGVYLYTTDHTASSGRASAKWVISQLGGKKLTMPVAFDWEEILHFQELEASINDINDTYAAFKDELSKAGLTAMIYGSPPTLNGIWSEESKASSPVWLAHYVDKSDYKGSYGIWQVCYGRIPGINANTDFNVLYTDRKYR